MIREGSCRVDQAVWSAGRGEGRGFGNGRRSRDAFQRNARPPEGQKWTSATRCDIGQVPEGEITKPQATAKWRVEDAVRRYRAKINVNAAEPRAPGRA